MSASSRIAGLDGLRAVAVLLVFVEHKVVRDFGLGSLGVDVFFVLSGFLIVGILHGQRARIEAGGSRIGTELKTFWLKRARRILPVYYLAVIGLIVYFVALGIDPRSTGVVPWYVLLAPNVYIGWVSKEWTWYTHLWSVGVEQHFYLLIAPLLLVSALAQHARVLQALLLVSLLVTLAQCLAGSDPRSIYVSSWSNFALMATGGLLSIARDRRPLGKLTLGACVASIAVLALLTYTPIKGYAVDASYRVLSSLLGLVIGATLIGHVVSHPHGRLTRLLEWAPLRGLGVISYGFYVYHALLPRLPMPAAVRSSAVAVALIDLAFCVAVSALSWHLMEKRLLGRRPVRRTDATLPAAAKAALTGTHTR